MFAGLSAQQLCDGNLGINIFSDGDFGSGASNILSTDPGIAPGYTYQAAPATPADGSYVITNNTAGWSFHFPTWLTLTDNSSDPNGYFMLVNASFEPGEFYSNQVTGLCENTLYEFSADIINVVRSGIAGHIFPNVSFLIDDVVVFSTGDIFQTETWNKFGFTFTTEVGQTEIKLSLRNNAPGGNGNDLALDNISFQPCGPNAFISTDQTIFLCADEINPTEIRADISAATPPAIIWQTSRDSINWMDIPGATSTTIFHDDFTVGTYYYRYISATSTIEITNEFCSIISEVLTIEVLPLTFSATDTICSGQSFIFGTQNLTTSGTYTEPFISSLGCDSIVTLDLNVLDEETILIVPSLSDPSCFGGIDGWLRLDFTPGILGPYVVAVNDNVRQDNFFERLSAGNYTVSITNRHNCTQSFDLELQDPPEFNINVPSDTLVELGESIDVSVSANQAIQEYNWSTEELSPFANILDFSFTPTVSQVHTAIAINESGCIAEQSFQVTVSINNLDVYFPNIFNPNSDTSNSFYTIGSKPGLITEVAKVNIYDRWGNLVADKSNTNDLDLWDGRINGKEAEIGIYIYLIELTLLDGNTYPFNGEFMLFR